MSQVKENIVPFYDRSVSLITIIKLFMNTNDGPDHAEGHKGISV